MATPPFQVYPPFQAKHFVAPPQVTHFLEGPTPYPFNKGGEGVPTMLIRSFLGPKIWNVLPNRLKNANSIEAFKMQIKKWKPEKCPCRLCKVYVQNVGFV